MRVDTTRRPQKQGRAKSVPDFATMPLQITFDVEDSGWETLPKSAGFDAVFVDRERGLSCIVSWAPRPDGRRWLHVSLAHAYRLPTYDELCEAKRRFVGPHRRALMVFPDERVHVNIHQYCLHLWCGLDGDGLPEFSGVLPGIGRSI